MNILIVEDEASLLDMLSTIFTEEGYQVSTATNGVEAWNLIQTSTSFNLLITDLFMPEMNGVELIKKCQNFFPTMKTILLSGGGKYVEAVHGSQTVTYLDEQITIGVYLKKPCNLNELLSQTEKVLKQ